MTMLSVNINKIALLRNSRGRNFPDVTAFAARCLDLGAHGITLHPRPDQRHARYQDVEQLQQLCLERDRELNVEGYPCTEFLSVVQRVRPAQCTLVPDSPDQLTSDHGWDIRRHAPMLRPIIAALRALDIRVSLFVDAGYPALEAAREVGADRIELYTEPYAQAYGGTELDAVLQFFEQAVAKAHELGLAINAGHDLNLQNLPRFLELPGIQEVSIGHALIVECIESGMERVIADYLAICRCAAMP